MTRAFLWSVVIFLVPNNSCAASSVRVSDQLALALIFCACSIVIPETALVPETCKPLVHLNLNPPLPSDSPRPIEGPLVLDEVEAPRWLASLVIPFTSVLSSNSVMSGLKRELSKTLFNHSLLQEFASI